MKATLKKIGNSQGLIIPAAIIKQLGLGAQVEMTLSNGALIIQPVRAPRQGWFDHYKLSLDHEPLKHMVDLDSEQDAWEW